VVGMVPRWFTCHPST